MIMIPPEILHEIIGHARTDVPVEACGLLAGQGQDVRKSYRLTNIDNSSEHFSLDPKEQFSAVKNARSQGFEVLAVYHSHPSTPARMSREDLRLAVAPGLHYVIISLADPERVDVRSFVLKDGEPIEEQISLVQELYL